jgi:hypothetical protein
MRSGAQARWALDPARFRCNATIGRITRACYSCFRKIITNRSIQVTQKRISPHSDQSVALSTCEASWPSFPKSWSSTKLQPGAKSHRLKRAAAKGNGLGLAKLVCLVSWRPRGRCNRGWRLLQVVQGVTDCPPARSLVCKSPLCWSPPKTRINDKVVSLLPRGYRVDEAFLPKCVRSQRGDGRAAWMNCGLSIDLIGCHLLGLEEIWESDGRTSHAAIGF